MPTGLHYNTDWATPIRTPTGPHPYVRRVLCGIHYDLHWLLVEDLYEQFLAEVAKRPLASAGCWQAAQSAVVINDHSDGLHPATVGVDDEASRYVGRHDEVADNRPKLETNSWCDTTDVTRRTWHDGRDTMASGHCVLDVMAMWWWHKAA